MSSHYIKYRGYKYEQISLPLRNLISGRLCGSFGMGEAMFSFLFKREIKREENAMTIFANCIIFARIFLKNRNIEAIKCLLNIRSL